MPNTFNSIPQELTARAIANNFSNEEKLRRESAMTNKDFYYGQMKAYVTTFNIDVEPMSVNYTRPIMQKRSTLLYNQKLVRDIQGPSASINLLEQVYTDNDIDDLMLKADLLTELTGSVLVMPAIDTTLEGGIKLHLYDGTAISVVPEEDDPNEADAVSLVRVIDRLQEGWDNGNPQNDRVLQQQIWTKDSVVLYKGAELALSETNELGFLPFVNFQGEEVYGQYIGYAPGTIVRKLNAHINQKLTDLSYTVKMQAATPVVVTGYQSGEDMIVSPGRALSLPIGADAKTLNLAPEIEETLMFIQFLEEKIYDTSSVPKISIVGGEGVSGRELLVRWFPLTQVFREKSVRYEKYELELANMILKVLGAPEVESIKINYPDEDNLPYSPKEELIERDIKLGLTSPSLELMRVNTDLTQEEAKAEIQDNLDETMGSMPEEENAIDKDGEDPEKNDPMGNPFEPKEEEEDSEEDTEVEEKEEEPEDESKGKKKAPKKAKDEDEDEDEKSKSKNPKHKKFRKKY